jgi:hypothetical protein
MPSHRKGPDNCAPKGPATDKRTDDGNRYHGNCVNGHFLSLFEVTIVLEPQNPNLSLSFLGTRCVQRPLPCDFVPLVPRVLLRLPVFVFSLVLVLVLVLVLHLRDPCRPLA